MTKTKKERLKLKRENIMLKKEIKISRKGKPPIVYSEFPHRNTHLKRCLSEERIDENILFLCNLTSFRKRILNNLGR